MVYLVDFGAKFKILDRIEDKLWAKLQYSYEFMTFSVWFYNLINYILTLKI